MPGPVDALSTADYDKVMNLNTRSAFILTNLASPHLIASKGNIIHVSSVAGIRAFPGMVGYCMSKAAMDQLVRWGNCCPLNILNIRSGALP